MSAQMEEFKSFVKQHPGLRDVVINNKRTWQSIYEEWVFYKDSNKWQQYRDPNIPQSTSNAQTTAENVPKEDGKTEESTQRAGGVDDIFKNALNYVKKINPDSITKTVGGVQKIMALLAGFGGAQAAKNVTATKMTGDPLFDKKFDEWY